MDKQTTPYYQAFSGSFSGILRWHQLDDLWKVVNNTHSDDWYIYAIGEAPPENPSTHTDVKMFIQEIDKLLRQEHDESYCGIVYVDDKTTPSFIKIFDPNNLGTSCSTGLTPPLPAWTLSKIQPIDLPTALPQPNNRKRWWRSLFKRT